VGVARTCVRGEWGSSCSGLTAVGLGGVGRRGGGCGRSGCERAMGRAGSCDVADVGTTRPVSDA
jgi:hypothetical protein